MLHHLRIVLPAAAAVIWVVGKLRRGSQPSLGPAPAADQDEGAVVELDLPADKAPQPLFDDPPPLKAVLLDVTVPVSLAALWLALFHNSSTMLSDFHQQLGDLDFNISQWRRQKDDVPRRVLRYTTRLNNPLGPRQAVNTEVMDAVDLGAAGFTLHTRCTSEGVPFAACFANHIQWVASPYTPGISGIHSCRLRITGECQFHSPVWGPLKGQIERESIKGMAKAYRTLVGMLAQQYSAVEAGSEPSGSSAPAAPGKLAGQRRRLALGAHGTPAAAAAAASGAGGRAVAGDRGEGMNISALLQNPQTNAAAFLMIVMVVALMWRIAFFQPILLQAARGVAGAVGRG